MKVCSLTNGRELHAAPDGLPFYWEPRYGPPIEGCVDEPIGEFVDPEDKRLVNEWQADLAHDNLRARGDPRWQAACSFTQRPTWD